jgi:aldose 1-epimerase
MMTKLSRSASAEPDGQGLFRLENAGGMTVTISERGAALHSWRAPDRYGRMAEMLLAETAPDATARWHGCHAGGGVSLLSIAPDGSASRSALYRLGDDGSLRIDHEVVAMAATPLGARTHPRFSLNGGSADAGDHLLWLEAGYYVEVGAGGIPISVATVAGTAFDFRQPAPIGARLGWPDSQIRMAGGFDHCFFVRNHFAGGQGELREVAQVADPGSGRCLRLSTTEAAVRFCMRKFDPGIDAGPTQGARQGFWLDADSRPELASATWPQVVLRPGQVYRQTTVYQLSLQR